MCPSKITNGSRKWFKLNEKQIHKYTNLWDGERIILGGKCFDIDVNACIKTEKGSQN